MCISSKANVANIDNSFVWVVFVNRFNIENQIIKGFSTLNSIIKFKGNLIGVVYVCYV